MKIVTLNEKIKIMQFYFKKSLVIENRKYSIKSNILSIF